MSIQQSIISGIRELLYQHDYLVLPGFGGFVLKARPAHFSSSGGALMPPSKTVTYNSQLRQNDGILSAWLQNHLGCTVQEASEHISGFSEYCQSVLSARRRLSIDGIGFFYLDFENNTCFEPRQDANFLASSFGLGPVELPAPVIEKNPEKQAPVFKDREATGTREHKTEKALPKKGDYRKLIAPAAFVLVVSCLVLILAANSQFRGQLTSSVFGENAPGVYAPVEYAPLPLRHSAVESGPYVADANGIAVMRLDEEKSIPVKVLESSAGAHVSRAVSHYRFEIVLGCFSVQGNATRMVRSLSSMGTPAFLSGRNAKGMYVVSTGKFDSRDEALESLGRVKESFPTAWIRERQ